MAIGSEQTRGYYAFLTSFLLVGSIIAYKQLMGFYQQYPDTASQYDRANQYYALYPPRTVSFWVMSGVVAILLAYPIYIIFCSE